MSERRTDIRDLVFTARSYTPIPFLLLGLIFGLPNYISLLSGAAVAVLGEVVRAWGVAHAHYETRVTENVGASRLVTSGPFAYVRNPLYVGNILLYTGFGVMANLWWLTVAALVWFVIQYWLIVSREEEFLASKFGDEYERYRQRVPRFLPRLTRCTECEQASADWSIAWRSERRTLQAFSVALVLLVARGVLGDQLGW